MALWGRHSTASLECGGSPPLCVAWLDRRSAGRDGASSRAVKSGGKPPHSKKSPFRRFLQTARACILLGGFVFASLVPNSSDAATNMVAVDSRNTGSPLQGVAYNEGGDRVWATAEGATYEYDKNDLSSGNISAYDANQSSRDMASIGSNNWHYDGFACDEFDTSENLLDRFTIMGYDHLGAIQIDGENYIFLVDKESGNYKVWQQSTREYVREGSLPNNLGGGSTGMAVLQGTYEDGTLSDDLDDALWYICNGGVVFSLTQNQFLSEERRMNLNGVTGSVQDIDLERNPDNLTARVYVAVDVAGFFGQVNRQEKQSGGDIEVYTIPDAGFTQESISFNESTTPTLTVGLSRPAEITTTIDYAVLDGTAKNGEDYNAPTTGTLTFNVGDQFKTIPYQGIDDSAYGNDETFQVLLSNARGCRLTTPSLAATIRNDDPAPDLTLDTAPVTIAEGDGTTGTVRLTLDAPAEADVTFRLHKTNATAGDADVDLDATRVYTFPAGATELDLTLHAP